MFFKRTYKIEYLSIKVNKYKYFKIYILIYIKTIHIIFHTNIQNLQFMTIVLHTVKKNNSFIELRKLTLHSRTKMLENQLPIYPIFRKRFFIFRYVQIQFIFQISKIMH